jgi:hypothetical protein
MLNPPQRVKIQALYASSRISAVHLRGGDKLGRYLAEGIRSDRGFDIQFIPDRDSNS